MLKDSINASGLPDFSTAPRPAMDKLIETMRGGASRATHSKRNLQYRPENCQGTCNQKLAFSMFG